MPTPQRRGSLTLISRPPELERAHLAIRHPPASRQRVRPAQLALSDPLRGGTTYRRGCGLGRVIPCSDQAKRRHKIIGKGVALVGEESVSGSRRNCRRVTVRGVFSGTLKKKLGLIVASAKEERGRVYRIAEPTSL